MNGDCVLCTILSGEMPEVPMGDEATTIPLCEGCLARLIEQGATTKGGND